MEPMALAGMIFSLIVLVLIGGFILLLPLSRRVGHLLDVWATERKGLAGLGVEPGAITETLGDLSRRLAALEEQQGFLLELATKRGELPAVGEGKDR